MNDSCRNSYTFFGDNDPYLASRPHIVREVVTGDYYIPSSVLRKIVFDFQELSNFEDTSDALDSLLKVATNYEIYLRNNQ